ncbi:MAG: cyclic nucleotide-binding domain-containing protein [Synechococcaceae cyanobacterium SM2_3_1]|nr:cyclic nucleotide-binding domain-containing protein [Synechococcaceae cyanobacterium SM2_3_1]
MAYCILAMNAANSLFLSHVGAELLPICFILLGLFSAGAYIAITPLLDNISRPKLFQYTFIFSTVLAVALRGLLFLDQTPVYFLTSIYAFFQFDLFINILYPSLVKDYFTTLEYKRYASYIGIAQASGILLGGTVTILLSNVISTADFFPGLTGLCVITLALVSYLRTTQRPIDNIKSASKVNLINSLKSAPYLFKRYPLSIFLASSSFLFILIYILSEFLWFSIYDEHLEGAALTEFLGQIRIASSGLQIVVLFFFTRPLLRQLGVTRMNVVYPLTTLAALFSILWKPELRSAIALNLNGDSLAKCISTPVHQLNFNAIPAEVSGRVRALSDGLVYATGLTLAGGLLWVAHSLLTLQQITWIGVGLGIVSLLLRLPMGRLYVQGLEDMIRSNALNLDDVNLQLPAQSSSVIRELLSETDLRTQIKGLELAAALRSPGQFLPEIESLLSSQNLEVRRALVQLFKSHADNDALRYFESLLESERAAVRSLALEILFLYRYPFTQEQISSDLQDPDPTIKFIGVVIAMASGINSYEAKQTFQQLLQRAPFPEAAAYAVIRMVEASQDRELMPLLLEVINAGSGLMKRSGLLVLSGMSPPEDLMLAEFALHELGSPDPLVRVAALNVLGITHCQQVITEIGECLGDEDPRVQEKAAVVLATYGKPGLNLAQKSLTSSNPDVVNAAIAAIGKVRTRAASDILYQHLTPDFQLVAESHRWLQQLPQTDPSWQPLALAIEDFHQRLIQKVLYVLACLGYPRTVSLVKRALNTKDAKEFANAVEVLASRNHRRFILPILPVLEQAGGVEQPQPKVYITRKWLRTKGYKLLFEALEAKDRWITVAALVALAMVPTTLMRDPDPLIQHVASETFQLTSQFSLQNNTLMNRILFLKKVGLFHNMLLDELLLVDNLLEQQHIPSGERIYEEGSWSTHLYIIADGKIHITKTIDDQPRLIKELSTGDLFGEEVLFDHTPHWEGAMAAEESTLLKLEKSRFVSLIMKQPQMVMEMCRFLSQRLRESDRSQVMRKLFAPEIENRDIRSGQAISL